MAYKVVTSNILGHPKKVLLPWRRKPKKVKKKYIEPVRLKRCRCGRKIIGHHFLCQRCWLDKESKKADITPIQGGNHV